MVDVVTHVVAALTNTECTPAKGRTPCL